MRLGAPPMTSAMTSLVRSWPLVLAYPRDPWSQVRRVTHSAFEKFLQLVERRKVCNAEMEISLGLRDQSSPIDKSMQVRAKCIHPV